MGILVIISNDPLNKIVEVPLQGVGTPVTPIDETLAFFDKSVGEGTLEGSGPVDSAHARLKALRNMLEAARDLIDGGFIEDACHQLQDAYDRCDGESPPPDFVEGVDAPELNAMILELMVNLGCI